MKKLLVIAWIVTGAFLTILGFITLTSMNNAPKESPSPQWKVINEQCWHGLKDYSEQDMQYLYELFTTSSYSKFKDKNERQREMMDHLKSLKIDPSNCIKKPTKK